MSTLSGPSKSVAISLIMPTILSRANNEGESVYKETSARLLELAASDQAAFRGVVANMTDGQKQFMESIIVAGRKAGPGKADGENSEDREPTIALRMNFGA